MILTSLLIIVSVVVPLLYFSSIVSISICYDSQSWLIWYCILVFLMTHHFSAKTYDLTSLSIFFSPFSFSTSLSLISPDVSTAVFVELGYYHDINSPLTLLCSTGSDPLCLQNCISSSWHRFSKAMETFLRYFGWYWHIITYLL